MSCHRATTRVGACNDACECGATRNAATVRCTPSIVLPAPLAAPNTQGLPDVVAQPALQVVPVNGARPTAAPAVVADPLELPSTGIGIGAPPATGSAIATSPFGKTPAALIAARDPVVGTLTEFAPPRPNAVPTQPPKRSEPRRINLELILMQISAAVALLLGHLSDELADRLFPSRNSNFQATRADSPSAPVAMRISYARRARGT